MIGHMDGARLANAAAFLGCALSDLTTDSGLDILSFGGTKNGLLCAEAVVFFRSDLSESFAFLRKQSMQLASKMRYLSAQFIPYLEEELWLKNAQKANEVALYL
ncbi:MAG: threonine aldolase, partial [Hyphomicrobiales bacterium]